MTSLGRTFWEDLHQRDKAPAWILVGRDGEVEAVKAASTLQREIVTLAIGLEKQGLKPGDRVLLASPAKGEALQMALATWMLGAVTVHLEPGLPAGPLKEALTRARAAWILVDEASTLGALELASEEAVGAAHLIFMTAPTSGVAGARMTSWAQLMEAGQRSLSVRLSGLARQIFAVPPDARAAIMYWAQGETLQAAAFDHDELLAALAPPPASWGLGPGTVATVDLGLGSRLGLLTTLRLLRHNITLSFPDKAARLETIRGARPHLMVIDGAQVGSLLSVIDVQLNQGDDVRGKLKRGLGWLTRERQEQPRLTEVVGRLDRWLERHLERELVGALGGRLSILWAPSGVIGEDARTLLGEAGVVAHQDTQASASPTSEAP